MIRSARSMKGAPVSQQLLLYYEGEDSPCVFPSRFPSFKSLFCAFS